MKQAEWIEIAREFLVELPDGELQEATVWKVMNCFKINRHEAAEELIIAEKLKRGLISLADLSPDLRRKMVDPSNLDLKAIAGGPIMDPANIYLPAGKLSMAETRARESSQVKPA